MAERSNAGVAVLVSGMVIVAVAALVRTQARGLVEAEPQERFHSTAAPPSWAVLKVERETGRAWIDAGSEDEMQPGTILRAYDKRHHGVGRSDRDVKGTIRVTRIVDEHLSEAHIVEEGAESPIATNDPVFGQAFE